MINNAFEHRSKGKSIMTAESSRESNNRDDMRQLGRVNSSIWISYFGIEMRQNTAISGSK